MIPRIAFAVVLVGIGLFLGVHSSRQRNNRHEQVLFRKMLPSGNTSHERVSAARRLAESYPESSFIVWSLASNDPFLRGNDIDADHTRKAGDRGVLAIVMESLPDDATTEVLLAVTCQLKDSERGRYSEETNPLQRADFVTEPLQEVALAVLKRNTGHRYNHGFNPERWRDTIMKLSRGDPSAESH